MAKQLAPKKKVNNTEDNNENKVVHSLCTGNSQPIPRVSHNDAISWDTSIRFWRSLGLSAGLDRSGNGHCSLATAELTEKGKACLRAWEAGREEGRQQVKESAAARGTVRSYPP